MSINLTGIGTGMLVISIVITVTIGCGATTGGLNHPSSPVMEEARLTSSPELYGALMFWFYPNLSFRVPLDVESDKVQWAWSWEFPILIRAGGRRHGGALSVAQYMEADRISCHAVYHYRLASTPEEDEIVHLFLGAGVFGEVWEEDYLEHFGMGPRGELRLQIGGLRSGQVLLMVAYERELDSLRDTLEFSAGLTMPLQF